MISRLLRPLQSLWWETYLGIDTRGMVDPVIAGGVHYSPLPYGLVFRMLDRLHLQGTEVLADLGSGKGRVLCVASRRVLGSAIGIEVNRDLLDIARRNLTAVRGKRTPVRLVEAPAQDYSYADVDVIVMYNPFDERTMRQVFEKISDSYWQNTRTIKVAYANCVHENVLSDLGWLKKVDDWPRFAVAGFPHRTSFWESKSAKIVHD